MLPNFELPRKFLNDQGIIDFGLVVFIKQDKLKKVIEENIARRVQRAFGKILEFLL